MKNAVNVQADSKQQLNARQLDDRSPIATKQSGLILAQAALEGLQLAAGRGQDEREWTRHGPLHLS